MTSTNTIAEANHKNEEITKEFGLQKVKEKMEEIRAETAAQIDDQLQRMINEILIDIQKKDVFEGKIRHLFNNDVDETHDKVKTKPGHLPDKLFMARNSLLTDLLEIKHIRSIYHIFAAIMFGLFVNTTIHDLFHKGEISLGFNLILKGFANFHSLLILWLCMFFTTLAVYVAMDVWTSVRSQLIPKSIKSKLWDKLCLVLYCAYIISFSYYFTNLVVKWGLTPPESLAALTEMVRLLMKAHAYVRSNVPRLSKPKTEDSKNGPYLNFSKFLYFLFAPTLIYRDNYPRTKHIRWNFVITCFAEVIGCIFYLSYIGERFIIPVFEDFGRKPCKWQDVVLMILGNGMAGGLVLLCIFYAVLHAWVNAFAEMLRFADRLFYKDWWTSHTFERYYRTWNVVVHDWLYTYIYKDFVEIVTPNNKVFAKIMVFFVSAVVHELILGFTFRFFYPMLFILFFGFGLAVSFLKITNSFIGNIGIWYGLALGTGIMVSTYCMEFYARMNCPIEDQSIIQYFIPRSISCYL